MTMLVVRGVGEVVGAIFLGSTAVCALTAAGGAGVLPSSVGGDWLVTGSGSGAGFFPCTMSDGTMAGGATGAGDGVASTIFISGGALVTSSSAGNGGSCKVCGGRLTSK